MQAQHCHFCGHFVSLVHVHGHYQCPVCHTNALPCCDSDNCDTNMILNQQVNNFIQLKETNIKHPILDSNPS